MEQVDGTIIPILNQIGCSFAGDHENIANWGANELYIASSTSMRAIDPDIQIPPTLPPSKAGRFRATSTLASAIEALGWTDEMGYQSFLYPNEKDMRRLLMWLVDKLPKIDNAEEAEEVVGEGATQQRAISDALRKWTQAEWSPLDKAVADKTGTMMLRTVPLCTPNSTAAPSEETKLYWKTAQPLFCKQPSRVDHSHLPASVFEHNATKNVIAAERERNWDSQSVQQRKAKMEALKSLIGEAFRGNLSKKRGKDTSNLNLVEYAASMLSAYESGFGGDYGSSAFSRRADFSQESGDKKVEMVTESGAVAVVTPEGETEEEKAEKENAIRREREAELQALQETIRALRDKRRAMEQLAEENANQARQIEAELGQKLTKTAEMEKAFKVKKQTLDLLPNAAENLKKLSDIAQASAERLVQLAGEWESKRVPLVTKYRRKKQLILERKSEVGTKVEAIKRMRVEMKQKAQQLREKDALYKQVLEELAKMPKSINRQVYVRRIMDIVKNLEKQKVDIARVLEDVRMLQKDINSLSQKSKRTFDLVDERVYAEAKNKNTTAKEVYRNIVLMRDGFVELVKNVENTGKVKNEIRDTSARIEALESRNTGLNMKSVAEDLAAVKDENKKLATKIKALRASS
mmetsp:Transcript_23693/g.46665  ORF Transcript_23693/g.46665 Transcript_23693/m.46665 type:complete len:635 (-) Transcript_23693:401-2305(-)|eukprot:CAMPEP_0175137908 /NCGR_PEP_ID=MMETSP0087-20121206/10061_1 /TAXON_ID=136419 /ORGANISM="Unknown Unknown, Strain D1" /LENGTH=634 /DNA_ID=CAMNT_0016420765 /DNA_START=33 /DNA_END=1937 /DNA_ORIENTATION=-